MVVVVKLVVAVCVVDSGYCSEGCCHKVRRCCGMVAVYLMVVVVVVLPEPSHLPTQGIF